MASRSIDAGSGALGNWAKVEDENEIRKMHDAMNNKHFAIMAVILNFVNDITRRISRGGGCVPQVRRSRQKIPCIRGLKLLKENAESLSVWPRSYIL